MAVACSNLELSSPPPHRIAIAAATPSFWNYWIIMLISTYRLRPTYNIVFVCVNWNSAETFITFIKTLSLSSSSRCDVIYTKHTHARARIVAFFRHHREYFSKTRVHVTSVSRRYIILTCKNAREFTTIKKILIIKGSENILLYWINPLFFFWWTSCYDE